MKKRILSVLIAACLVTTLFTGCGKGKNKEESIVDQTSKIDKEHVFKVEQLKIEGVEANMINSVFVHEDRVYAAPFAPDGEKEIKVYSFKSDGSDVKTISIPCEVNCNFANWSMDKDGNIYAIKTVYNYGDAGDGEVSTFEYSSFDGEESLSANDETDEVTGDASDEVKEQGNESTSDEVTENVTEGVSEENSGDSTSEDVLETTEYVDSDDEEIIYLLKCDNNGKVLSQVDLTKECKNEDGYVSIVNSFFVTDDGKPVFSTDYGIATYDENSGVKYIVDNKAKGQTIYYNLFKGASDKFFVNYYDDNGINFCSFDPSKGTIGEASSSVQSSFGGYAFFGGNGYDLYFADGSSIYGYELKNDSKTKIVDMIDSDYPSTDSMGNSVAISDTEFVCCIPDSEYNYNFYRMTKIPSNEVKDKQIITIAGYYIDHDVRKLAQEFNNTNDAYKIKFIEYNSFNTEDNYEAGAEKFNMDIVSGNVPDIIIIGDNMPVESYANKGLFLDLTSYFQNDPDLAGTEFLTNIMDSVKTNDKQYMIIPSFEIGTMLVKSKFADGRNSLSFKDCDELIEKTGAPKDKAFGYSTREYFLEGGLEYSGTSYIDWENRKCYFNSDAFINFIEYSSRFPEEMPDSYWEDYKETSYMEDESLFQVYRLAGFSDYAYCKYITFGADISMVGYPNDVGENNSIIYPTMRMAISSQSKHKDVAFDFVKKFLSEEYQDEITYGFPVRKSSFDKAAAKSMERPYYMDDGKKVEYDQTYFVGSTEVVCKPLTKEEVQLITDFIKGLDKVFSNNQGVFNIIKEEVSAYYSGQKTSQEVADIIQSRLSIYVNENS